MTLLLLAVLPSAVALTLLIALLGSVVVRTFRGERWTLPLTSTNVDTPIASVPNEAGVLSVNPVLEVPAYGAA